MSGMYDKGPVLGAAPPSVHRSNIKPGWCEHVPKDSDWLEIAFRCRMFNWLYAMMIPVIPVWVLGFSLCSIKQGLPSLRFEICPSLNIHIYIYIYIEKLHTVVSTHLLYVGSNCCKAQGLDESVEDRLNLNTAPQFGTLVVPHCLYKKDCC